MNGRLAVQRLRGAMLALVASVLACLHPAAPAQAGTIELSDILDIDPLGYRCIPSQYFDDGPDGTAAVAFSLSGKTRLPRTCLPDPCERALTPQELSQLTGTEPILARFSDEWDDYFARYADHCRREIVVSRPRGNDGFWKPILNRAKSNQRVGLPTSSRLIPYIISNYRAPSPEQPLLISFASSEVQVGPLNQPSPVPVPASGWLIAAVLGFGAYQSRRAQVRRKG